MELLMCVFSISTALTLAQMVDFLLRIFIKDPQLRPSAKDLLALPIMNQQRSLRGSKTRSKPDLAEVQRSLLT